MSRGIVDRLERWEAGGADGSVFAIEREPGRPWVRLVIEKDGQRTVTCFDLEHDQDPEALMRFAEILSEFAAPDGE